MDNRAAASLLLLTLLAAGCAGGGTTSSTRSRAELTNPFLGPDYTAWLIGPISRLATPQEEQQFLALQDDQQAAAFVEAFWNRRDPAPDKPGNQIREAFEKRSTEADRRYGEAGYLGRRTDRGVVYVLYGNPAKSDFEVGTRPGSSPIEVWTYGADAPSGLDGKRPSAVYRFIKQGELTVLYGAGQPRTLIDPQGPRDSIRDPNRDPIPPPPPL
ncbi:MAG TPA: GWxTD domain-containing protein [Thermoanaerobaculia bacterium]|nr:GWxTD domain-containing protein [Thermoanaerobaculia bacterium]